MNNKYMGINPNNMTNNMAMQRTQFGATELRPQHVQMLQSCYLSKEEKVEIGAEIIKTGLTGILAYKAGQSIGVKMQRKADESKPVELTDQQKLKKSVGELKNGMKKVGAGSFGLLSIGAKNAHAELKKEFAGKKPHEIRLDG